MWPLNTQPAVRKISNHWEPVSSPKKGKNFTFFTKSVMVKVNIQVTFSKCWFSSTYYRWNHVSRAHRRCSTKHVCGGVHKTMSLGRVLILGNHRSQASLHQSLCPGTNRCPPIHAKIVGGHLQYIVCRLPSATPPHCLKSSTVTAAATPQSRNEKPGPQSH